MAKTKHPKNKSENMTPPRDAPVTEPEQAAEERERPTSLRDKQRNQPHR